MKTESKESEDQARKADTPLRRAGHVGLSILNPFSDLVVIYRKAMKPAIEKLKLLTGLLTKADEQPDADPVGTSWHVAVARSGRSIEQLLSSYSRIRTAWWFLMVVTGCLSLILLALLLLANFSLPSSTFLRALTTLLVLVAVASWGFVKTLIATYRLWQLQEKRVSVAERGTFKDFLTETRWCRLVLTRGHIK